MTILEILDALESVNDADTDTRTRDGRTLYCVTLNDFDGFSDDWDEIEREYELPEMVDTFLAYLELQCLSKTDDFYCVYHFADYDIQLGFASFDI